ncbi:MAG: NAD(P)/FAD-dependent oxidoreductase [Clostridioides sp.]|nr:NAD(P)/FAD-dependent oxidoreductase [Clostridioides sp.]
MKKVVVIGGGPAGIMAACTASNQGNDVILIEKNRKLGRKLVITGKGRCNITNDCDVEEFIENIPTNSKFLYSALYTFTNYDLVQLLNDNGLDTKVERGKRIFPTSDRALDVVICLEKLLKKAGVDVMLGTKVKRIIAEENKIKKVVLDNSKTLECDSIVVATGGISYPLTGSTGDGYKFAKEQGHTVVDLKPALIGLEVEEAFVKNLEKLSLRNVAISLFDGKKKIYDDFGEMEFTKSGVDGPIIKSASSRMKKIEGLNYSLSIDLKPALGEDKLDSRIQKDFKKYNNKNFDNSLNDLLPRKLIPVVIDLSGIDPHKPVHQVSREERKKLVSIVKNLRLTIMGTKPIEEAIVTSGGIKVTEINSSTMESKLVKGLFFAGEIIDVDGYTGGFNLQIAFSTGYLAGFNC